jgi:hypothetical protein
MIKSLKPKLQFLSFYLLLLVFICLTIYLGVVTWNIQNSCPPMIGPDKCREIIETCKIMIAGICFDRLIDPDIIGLLIGALIITGLGILGAPVLTVLTAGTGVWFLVRETIKAISGS